MTAIAIYAGRILTPQEELLNNVIVVEAGRITAIGNRDEVHIPPGAKDYVAPGMTVVPGFVDVHIHGAGGHDVMEATAEALETIAATVARHGTTAMVATTVTASEMETRESVAGIAQFIFNSSQFPARELGAEIVGIHFEGPFISPVRRGVHPKEWIILPSQAFLSALLKEARGTANILTLAPELPGALEMIAVARLAGLVVSLGHTDATFEQAKAA